MFILVPAYPGSPGQKAVKWLCVCLCVLLCHLLDVALNVWIVSHTVP